ncbi:MAG: CHAP domain-containing protein, partial [Myxococcaceae bacterium]|nr:CHAP domain-containing protein [Myxococcaceae bacterium]MCI0672677.1 CHAP domain-containing protein [Myxococcaceae bacterium]
EVTGQRKVVARRAAERVGRRGMPGGLGDDCAGLVRHAFRSLEVDLMPDDVVRGENAVTAMHREMQRRGALSEASEGMSPGDIVFFRETYDRNRDGKRNDGLTHVGIVEKVEEDGTVVFIHRGMRGVARSRFNTERPDVRADAKGNVLNEWLRRRSKRLRAYFAGELYAGFASMARLLGVTPVTPREEAPAREVTRDVVAASGCLSPSCARALAPKELIGPLGRAAVRVGAGCGLNAE